MTLHFADATTEGEYRRFAQLQALPDVRFGILLAIALYAIFGVLDFWIAPEFVVVTLSLRAAVIEFCLLTFAVSFQPWFQSAGQWWMAVATVVIGAGIAAMLAVIGPVAADRYYVGLILVVIASYAMFGLRFTYATLASASLAASFLLVEFLLTEHPGYAIFNNAMFLLSAWVISGYGGYASERSHRLAFFRQNVIEEQHRQSKHHSLHDPLTGVANRRLLVERLEHACQRARRHGRRLAVLFIDLDAFKAVNDTHGHSAGDRLLQEVAGRLARAVRASDTVARLGGDEFVILLDDVTSVEAVHHFVDRLAVALEESVRLEEEVSVAPRYSMGFSIFPEDGENPQDLLSTADRAMYEVKRRTKTAH